MKISTHRFVLLAGAFVVLGASFSAPSALAKPNKAAKRERKEERKERKQDRREDRRDARRNRPDYGNYRPGYGNYRPGYGNPRPGGINNGARGYTGEVVNVVSANRVDVRISGRLYNVYLVSRLPRGLNRGDVVRVDGVRSGTNDIRQARLQLLRNG